MALATKEVHWPTALYAALSQVDPTKGHVRNFHPKWQEDLRADQRLFIVNEILAKGLVPPPAAIDALMTQCCVDNMPRLALELSKKFKALPGIAEISLTSWIAILTSSADNFYVSPLQIVPALSSLNQLSWKVLSKLGPNWKPLRCSLQMEVC